MEGLLFWLSRILTRLRPRKRDGDWQNGEWSRAPELMIFWRTTSIGNLRFNAGNGGTELLHRTWRSQGE
jgi:hypothetical protein